MKVSSRKAMPYSLITSFYLTLSFFCCTQVSASSNALELLHKIKLNSCLNVENCDENQIRECRAKMNQAFDHCDGEFYQNPKSTTNWAGCVGRYIKEHMTGREFGYIMHGQACEDPDKKEVNQTSGGMPRAAEHPGYFIAIGLDIDSPTLYSSPIAACSAGANRAAELINQKFTDMHMDIYVSGAKNTNAISGDGIIGYNLMLGKPTHKYGKCQGRKVSKYLKNWGRHKIGDEIKVGFEEDIYVVVDCKSSPKPAVCD